MYLSGRTAVQFQFQSPVRTPPAVPRRMPLPSSPLLLAIFISRFLPAAAHQPRSKGCYWLAFPVLNFAASILFPKLTQSEHFALFLNRVWSLAKKT